MPVDYDDIGGRAGVHVHQGKVTMVSEVTAASLEVVDAVRTAELEKLKPLSTLLERKMDATVEFQAAILALQQCAENLQTRRSLFQNGALSARVVTHKTIKSVLGMTVHPEEVMTAQVKPGTRPAGWDIEIQRLAMRHTIVAPMTATSAHRPLNLDFTLQLKTTSPEYTDVTIVPTQSLFAICHEINKVKAATGIQAILLSLGKQSLLSLHAQQTGVVMYAQAATGEVPALIPSQPDLDLTPSTVVDAVSGESGLLAIYRLHGHRIESTSNTITPVEGVTLELKQPAPGIIYRGAVEYDLGPALVAFDEFQQAWNVLNTLFQKHRQSKPDGRNVEGAELLGTELLEQAGSGLLTQLLRAKRGLDGIKHASLAEIGMTHNSRKLGSSEIDITKIGRLEIDPILLGHSLVNDFASVQALCDRGGEDSEGLVYLDIPEDPNLAFISHEDQPVVHKIDITSDGEGAYKATIRLDRGDYADSFYTIHATRIGTEDFIIFRGEKADEEDIRRTDIFKGFVYRLNIGSDGTYESDMHIGVELVINKGIMGDIGVYLKKMIKPNGIVALDMQKLAAEAGKLQEKEIEIEKKAVKKRAAAAQQAGRIEPQMARVAALKTAAKILMKTR